MSKLEIEEFFLDEELQTKYEERVAVLCDKLGGMYPEFDTDLHGEMVKQLARSEIQVFSYERSVSNDQESKEIVQLLSGERVHLRALYSQLMTSLKEIRGESSKVTVDIPKDFGEYLVIQLGRNAKEVDEPEQPTDDSTETDQPPSS